MGTTMTRRAALTAAASTLAGTVPVRAAPGAAPPTVPGAYALPDGQAKVSATLAMTPGTAAAPTVPRVLDVAMTPLGAAGPATRYEVELNKRLHVIAVSGDFGTFLHEHGEKPGADGHFRVPVRFPRGGPWNVYADAVPAGLGQQVMRFGVDLGGPAPAARPALPPPGRLDGGDGRYGARFDALDLRAGQDAELRVRLLRDGGPAPDITPFLGVAAHAVLISTGDLSYVHVHAAPAAAPAAGGTGAPMAHDMTGAMGHAHGAAMPAMPGMDGGHGAMPGMGGAPLPAGARISPDLVLHVHAPKAGTYAMWLQFMGGGQVHTVPFTVAVA